MTVAQLFGHIFALYYYNIFTLLQQTLYLGCGNSWYCSTPSSPYVLLTQIDTNIVARSVPCIFIFYLYSFMFGEHEEVLIPSILLCSLCD